MKTRKRPDYLRLGVHAFGLAPLGFLLAAVLLDQLTVNPIQNIEQRLGHYAFYMIVASLAVTPLNTVFGWRALIRHRRTLGLYAFFYACLHFGVFFGVDYFFDVREVLMLTIEKPFIWLGLTGLLILIALAVTSYRWAMKQMGRSWQTLHRLIYLAAVILVIHYAWAKKGNLATLSGEIIQPLIFGIIVAVLLILRIPPVRRWAGSLRYRWPRRSIIARQDAASQPAKGPSSAEAESLSANEGAD
jgi:sulfoxide reductase heme-binding subunit YedZ